MTALASRQQMLVMGGHARCACTAQPPPLVCSEELPSRWCAPEHGGSACERANASTARGARVLGFMSRANGTVARCRPKRPTLLATNFEKGTHRCVTTQSSFRAVSLGRRWTSMEVPFPCHLRVDGSAPKARPATRQVAIRSSSCSGLVLPSPGRAKTVTRANARSTAVSACRRKLAGPLRRLPRSASPGSAVTRRCAVDRTRLRLRSTRSRG